jgi:hypothetical protein
MHIFSRNKQIGWIETGLYQPGWKIDAVIALSEEWKTGYSHGIGRTGIGYWRIHNKNKRMKAKERRK